MKIAFNSQISPQPVFASTCVKSPLVVSWIDNSSLFKFDLNWDLMFKILKNMDEDRVNIYDLATLDGSDMCSMVALIDKLQEPDREKFLPIFASDINEKTIQKAKNGNIYVSNSDLKKFLKMKIDPNDYFMPTGSVFCEINSEKPYISDEYLLCTMKDNLKNSIIFDVKDMKNSIDDIKNDEKSIVFARNVWLYFDIKTREELLQKLSKKMKSGSILATGTSECKGFHIFEPSVNFAPLLKKYGFSPFENKRENKCTIWIKD